MESLAEHERQNGESDSDAISYLRNEIRKRDKDIHLAATFGKQLLEEKQVLEAKLNDLVLQNEALEQEKYGLQIDLDNMKQTLKSHSSEVDDLRGKFDSISKEHTDLQKEHSIILAKMANLNKENQDMKRDQEDKYLENCSLKNKIQLQEEQIKVFQNQVEASLLDVTVDDGLQLKEDLNMYITKNKDLQDALSECQYELEILKVKELRLNEIIKNLREEVAGRDKEIASYSVEVKKSKEEMAELQGEIEMMRFQGVDFNKKGNSMYAELDDRRKLVEKRFKLLDSKHKKLQKEYEERKQDLISARNQMEQLLEMKSFEHQQSYIDKLQSELKTAGKEIRSLRIKLNKMIRHQQALNAEDKVLCKRDRDEYAYLRTLLKQAREKEQNLEEELMSYQNKDIALNEKLLETQQNLYQAKLEYEICRKENQKLKLELKGMETMQSLEKKFAEDAERIPIIEVLPGFQATDKCVLNAGKNKALYDENGRTISDETILGKDCYSIQKSPATSIELAPNSIPSGGIKECSAHSKLNHINEKNVVTEQTECSPRIKAIVSKVERADAKDNCTHQ